MPILETERLVERFIDRPEYQTRLVKPALEVSRGSARQFSTDNEGLTALLKEIESIEYTVTKRSKRAMEDMLDGICGDGVLFKHFEGRIQPLWELSQDLRKISKFAESLADRTKEECMDVARALMIELPQH